MHLQEGLAVVSIARDVVVEMTPPATTMRGKFGSNLKRKLAIMRQCTSVTDRQTDRQMDTDIVA